jgi:hypothetical protein
MNRYKCKIDNVNGPLTKGKIYKIRPRTEKEALRNGCEYRILYYDGDESPGPLNDWFFTLHFELIKCNIPKHIKIL